MPTIQEYPQWLLGEHQKWHQPPVDGKPVPGGRQTPPGQPGSGEEFLIFHRNFLKKFYHWFNDPANQEKSKVSVEDVKPWISIPYALMSPSESPRWSDRWIFVWREVAAHFSAMEAFQTVDELGSII